MPAPIRLTSGFTQAAKFQPLGGMGQPDPFYYATFFDDYIPTLGANYTLTVPNSGSIAANSANGPNGRILFTTGVAAGNYASLQVPNAGLQYVPTKKAFFLCRMQLHNVSTGQLIAGLISTNTTPFTAVVDGIYFLCAAGSSSITLFAVTGSTTIGSVVIPAGILAADTDIDLGFQIDANGNIKAFVGNGLEGFKRQDFATLGPNYVIPASSLTGALTTALLSPTMGISNGTTAAAMTGVADFVLGAVER